MEVEASGGNDSGLIGGEAKEEWTEVKESSESVADEEDIFFCFQTGREVVRGRWVFVGDGGRMGKDGKVEG